MICFGLGTNQGDHSGYMPLAEALDTISRMNTVYVVSAAGNEAGRGHHFYGKMENTSDYQNVEVLVPENEGGFTMELWLRRRICLQSHDLTAWRDDPADPTKSRLCHQHFLSAGTDGDRGLL